MSVNQTKEIENLIKVIEKRRKGIINLLKSGMLSKEKYEQDLINTVYESLRFNLIGVIQIKKTLRAAYSIAWISFAIAFMSMGITIINHIGKI